MPCGGIRPNSTVRRATLNRIQLVETRKSVGVDQRALAEALGMLPQRLSDIECGHSPVPEGFGPLVRNALQDISRNRLKVLGSR